MLLRANAIRAPTGASWVLCVGMLPGANAIRAPARKSRMPPTAPTGQAALVLALSFLAGCGAAPGPGLEASRLGVARVALADAPATATTSGLLGAEPAWSAEDVSPGGRDAPSVPPGPATALAHAPPPRGVAPVGSGAPPPSPPFRDPPGPHFWKAAQPCPPGARLVDYTGDEVRWVGCYRFPGTPPNRPSEGDLHGRALGWYRDGRIAWREEGRDGQVEGTSLRFFPDGTPSLRDEMLHGRLHGRSLRWYPSGQMRVESTWQQGTMTSARFYREDGSIDPAGEWGP